MKDLRSRLPALIKRFPVLFWRRPADAEWPNDWLVVRPRDEDERAEQYRVLAPDLAFWYSDVELRFRKLDHEAQIMQNRFWRQNVALIIGGLAATTLGAVQTALGAKVLGIAITQAILTGVLAGLAVVIRSRRAQQGYLTARLKAERIKSEFFLFLGRVGGYSSGDPRAKLLEQVGQIEETEGAG